SAPLGGPATVAATWSSSARRPVSSSCCRCRASTGSSRSGPACPTSQEQRTMADDDFDEAEIEPEELAKPDELVALHTVTTELFELLRRWFAVPDEVMLDLTEIDSAVREMSDP